MKIQWDKNYELGVKIIDEQHMHFFEIMKKLDHAVETDNEKEALEVIEYLENYASFHFETEEGILEDTESKEAKKHIKEHKDYAKDLAALKKKAKTPKKALKVASQIEDFTINWLIGHILYTDKKCFKQDS
jgi:hemerythrin